MEKQARLTNQIKARKKLVKLLNRYQVESISEQKSPWNSTRENLEMAIILNWNNAEDEIEQIVKELIEQARKGS